MLPSSLKYFNDGLGVLKMAPGIRQKCNNPSLRASEVASHSTAGDYGCVRGPDVTYVAVGTPIGGFHSTNRQAQIPKHMSD